MKRDNLLMVAAICLMTANLGIAREWTDKSGQFRMEAEFIVIKNGKVILEKPDGSIISVAVDRLSDADKQHIQSLEEKTPAATANPPAAALPNAASGSTALNEAGLQDLAKKVHKIFEVNCYRCHGQDGANEGGFNFVLDLAKLTHTYVKSGDTAGSVLWDRMAARDEDSAMPPPGEEPRPSPDDIAAVREWIAAGAPAIRETKSREFISNEQILKHVLADLRLTSDRARKFNRYFTLTHLYNAGISADELRTYRLAFNKLINSLSWNSQLVTPHAVDPAETVFRIDIRDLNWTAEIWNEIAGANPYGLTFSGPDAQACYEEAKTETPWVRVDWFVFAASRPPLYHSILALPDTDAALEHMLHVNVGANIRQEKVARAGFNRSGVSQNNRLIERHSLPYGSYWKSYDFGGNIGRQNLFEYPMGPDTSEQSFRHDGGEIIFTLPNGLQGYLLVDSNGRRIDKGPTEIVSDPKRADRAVMNGVSCISCHYAGMIPKTDEIRPFVEANLKAFDDPESILALYPKQDALSRYMEEDGKRFAAALERIGVKKISRTGEPVSTMALRFEQELDARLAAAEFGFTKDEFEQRLAKSESVARTLGALRTASGTVKRDAFVEVFARAATEFGLTPSHDAPIARPAPVISANPNPKPAPSRRRSSRREDDIELNTGHLRRIGDLGWGASAIAFSPDGRKLAVGKNDRAVLMFDVDSGGQLDMHEDLNALGKTSAIAFTPDGKKLLTGGAEGLIIVWNVSPNGQISRAAEFAGHTDDVLSIVVSRDSRFVLSGGKDKRVRYWDIGTCRELWAAGGFTEDVKGCELPSDVRRAYVTDGELFIQFDLAQGKPVFTRRLGVRMTHAVSFSPKGDRLACQEHYGMKLWDAKTGRELPKIEDRELQWGAVFSPDGKLLCSGGSGKLSVWNTTNQQRLAAFEVGKHGSINCIAISSDGRLVAASAGSAGQDIFIFNMPKP